MLIITGVFGEASIIPAENPNSDGLPGMNVVPKCIVLFLLVSLSLSFSLSLSLEDL